MMKKLMCLILALVTALSLVACGSSNGGNNTNTGDVKLKVLEGVVVGLRPSPTVFWCRRAIPRACSPASTRRSLS